MLQGSFSSNLKSSILTHENSLMQQSSKTEIDVRRNLKILGLILLISIGSIAALTIFGLNGFVDILNSLFGKLSWIDFAALFLAVMILYLMKSAQEG